MLGPILFSLYVNDLPLILRNFTPVMYADDAALICAHESTPEAFCIANEEMKLISNWFHDNKLLLSVKKRKYMLIHSSYKATTFDSYMLQVEGEPIERVNSKTYVGVVIHTTPTYHLNWKMHIDSLCKKLSSVCFVIFKCRQFFDVRTLRNHLFCSFSQSHIILYRVVGPYA